MELFEKIRNDHRQGMSIRALADKHDVHRRTERQAIASSTPPPRKTPERLSPALGPWKATIRGWLEDDINDEVPKKQRHTAHRVWTRLVNELSLYTPPARTHKVTADVSTMHTDHYYDG